jgi:hypothetical protein
MEWFNMKLPYDSTCPVIYDNDAVIDVYADEYLMALASSEKIRLVGMITSSSIAPFNKYVPVEDFENSKPPVPTRLNMVVNRAHGVRLARESGFRNLPDPVVGIKGHLSIPPSGKIEDTVPFGSDGSRLILSEAKKASPDKPLVLIMGGPLSVAADAFLLEPSIADRVIIAWLGGSLRGMNDYNGGIDPWASYIVLQRMRLVHFPSNYSEPPEFIDGNPIVPKARLSELPDTPLRDWMMNKDCPTNDLPAEKCGDSDPAIPLTCSDYVMETKLVSFSHWALNDGYAVPAYQVPFYKDDLQGNTILVTRVDRDRGTKEWWRVMKDLKVWDMG